MGILEKMDPIHRATVHLPCARFPDNFPPTSTIDRTFTRSRTQHRSHRRQQKLNSGIRDGDHQENHQHRVSLPPSLGAMTVSASRTIPHAQRAFLPPPSPPSPVANRVGADRFPACGILVQRQTLPSCGVCLASPRLHHEPTTTPPTFPTSPSVSAATSCLLAVKVGERMASAGRRRGGQEGWRGLQNRNRQR